MKVRCPAHATCTRSKLAKVHFFVSSPWARRLGFRRGANCQSAPWLGGSYLLVLSPIPVR